MSRGRPRRPPPPPSPFWQALECFRDLWQSRYGTSYLPTPSDKNQLGRLVRSLSRDLLPELLRAFGNYLASPDPWPHKHHPLALFCTSGGFNTYRSQAPVLSAKEERTAEALRQFTNGEVGHGPR